MLVKFNKFIALFLLILLFRPVFAKNLAASATTSTSPKTSLYTQFALRPDFSYKFNQAAKNSLGSNEACSSTIWEIQTLPRIGANIVIYPYFAYLDYQKDYISESQFWQVINNVKPSIIPIRNQFNQDYQRIKTYPIGFYPSGIRYMKPWNFGESVPSLNILFSNLDLQVALDRSLAQIFNESSPVEVLDEIKHYATLLQRSAILNNISANISAAQKIKKENFSFTWLSQNAALDPQLIQATYLINNESK